MVNDTERQFEQVRRKIRQTLNLDKKRASLGDSNGAIYVPGKQGYVYVREKQADGLGIRKEVRLHPNANIPIRVGLAVLLGYDDDNELCLMQSDFAGQVQQGSNPWANNPLDPAFKYVNQLQFMTLLCHSTSPLSMKVVVRAWIYIQDNTVYGYAGELLDLTSSVPAAGNHLLAGIFIKNNQTAEIKLSTAQSTLDPLDLTDIQECVTASTTGSVACWFWRLYGGQTVVNDKAFPDGDNFLDGRQIINVDTALIVKEVDGAPLVKNVRTIRVSNGTLTDDGSGQVTITTGGGASTHNSLSGLQGGTTNEYYHLTSAAYTTVGSLANNVKLIDTATGPGLEVQKPDGSAFATIRSDVSTVITPSGGNGRIFRGKVGTPSSSLTLWDLMLGDATAQSGSNVGADFILDRFDDSGAFIDRILTVYRSTGQFNFAKNVMGGAVDPRIFDARLTPTSATPVLTTNVTGATTLYLALYKGDRIALWDGTLSVWALYTLTEKSIKATDTQTGTLNATTTVTGLTDTSQFVVGMEITGTNIPASTTIATIVSATSITMNNAATGSGSSSLTFKLPASTVYDVFCYISAGAPKLEFVAWSNSGAGTGARATALTTQNGIYSKNGDVTHRYVGTILTAATAGTIDHTFTTASGAGGAYPRLGVWNYYNRLPIRCSKAETTDTWNYNSATWRPFNGASSNISNRIEVVIGIREDWIVAQALAINSVVGNGGFVDYGGTGIGLNVTNANSAQQTIEPALSATGAAKGLTISQLIDQPVIGYNFYQMLEQSRSATNLLWVGDQGVAGNIMCSGLRGDFYG